MENLIKTNYKALRMSTDLTDKVLIVAKELGLSFSAFIRIAAEEKMDRFYHKESANIRDSIITAATRIEERVVGSGSLLHQDLTGLQKRDWNALSHAERTDIIKAYRAKKRGQKYNQALEEWFKFVE